MAKVSILLKETVILVLLASRVVATNAYGYGGVTSIYNCVLTFPTSF